MRGNGIMSIRNSVQQIQGYIGGVVQAGGDKSANRRSGYGVQ